jgi:hypothetical protein
MHRMGDGPTTPTGLAELTAFLHSNLAVVFRRMSLQARRARALLLLRLCFINIRVLGEE